MRKERMTRKIKCTGCKIEYYQTHFVVVKGLIFKKRYAINYDDLGGLYWTDQRTTRSNSIRTTSYLCKLYTVEDKDFIELWCSQRQNQTMQEAYSYARNIKEKRATVIMH